ncbi:unnamed protein product [Prunus armeniaca]
MSNLIRRCRSVTTTPSSEPTPQPASAATAPALMDQLAVGPVGSQTPTSSASSMAQPVSARRRHRPVNTTDTTSTDASSSQPEIDFLQLHFFTSPKKYKATGFTVYPIVGTLPSFLKNRHLFLYWTTKILITCPTNTAVFRRPGKIGGIITSNLSNVEHMLKGDELAVRIILSAVSEWSKASCGCRAVEVKVQTLLAWDFPGTGVVKLNVDGIKQLLGIWVLEVFFMIAKGNDLGDLL